MSEYLSTLNTKSSYPHLLKSVSRAQFWTGSDHTCWTNRICAWVSPLFRLFPFLRGHQSGTWCHIHLTCVVRRLPFLTPPAWFRTTAPPGRTGPLIFRFCRLLTWSFLPRFADDTQLLFFRPADDSTVITLPASLTSRQKFWSSYQSISIIMGCRPVFIWWNKQRWSAPPRNVKKEKRGSRAARGEVQSARCQKVINSCPLVKVGSHQL